jgi:predicted aminopeptidase
MGVFLRSVISLLAALALSGCETIAYYAQAVNGHLTLMGRAQTLQAVVADPATPQALRERLERTRSLREFASRELRLPDNASYRSYAELGRRYAVWNVVAAPEFSLEPVQSCFPVAGCVAYRGFFSREGAERHAHALRAKGNDVHVHGVPAYSTLGRFDDPLLSTFIGYPEAELARLLFHELAHQVAYVKDDSTFNESFAVAVEREGVRRWFETGGQAGGRAKELEAFSEAQRRNARFLGLLEATRARLGALYRTRLAPEAMRERKRAELEKLGSEPDFLRYAERRGKSGSVPDFEPAFSPNNALLAAFATYTQLVPAFERLLAQQGGDMERFYAAVRSLAAKPRAERGEFAGPPRSPGAERP